jgi:peroxiredoxin Q/BCP
MFSLSADLAAKTLCVAPGLFPIQTSGGFLVRIPILFVVAAAVVVAVGFVTVRATGQNDQAMPAVGQVAPGFTLPSQDGSQISLESFRGKWVVLYFYPKDMTSGCTIEAHNFQRDQAQFDAANAVILGVSVDTPESHKQFCTKEGLTFRLLADPEHKVVESYGSLGNYMGIKIANRHTFLIDPAGKIARVWPKVEVQHHSEEVLAALAESKK